MKNFITNFPGGILFRKYTMTLQTICLLPLDIDGRESGFTDVTEINTPPFGKFLQWDQYLLGIPCPLVSSGEITTNVTLFSHWSRTSQRVPTSKRAANYYSVWKWRKLRGAKALSTDSSLLLFQGGYLLVQRSGTVTKWFVSWITWLDSMKLIRRQECLGVVYENRFR